VAHVRAFERERSAAATGSQSYRDDDGDDDGEPVRPIGLDMRDL
jgi:hypothetical protein